MTESKHTPGPWFVEGEPDDLRVRALADERRIAHLATFLDPDVERDTAALIARAPDLLREVEELRAKVARYESTAPIVVDDSHLSDDDLRRLRQSLGESKVATGRIEIVTTHPELAVLRTQNAELLEAARKAVAWIWDPEADQLEQFERIADEFRRDTGFLRPGKADPMGYGSEEREKERNAAWEKWRRERSSQVINGLRAAIAKAKGGAE